MTVKTRNSKRYLSKRPRLKKRITKETTNAFWQEYAQKFQDANNSVTSGRNTFAVPIAGANKASGRDVQDVRWNSSGMERKDRLVYRESAAGDHSDEYRDRVRAAIGRSYSKYRRFRSRSA